MKIELNKEKVEGNFTEGQIKGFMKDLNMTYIEAVCYLYFFNNVSITTQERNKDCGRAMYIKFAKSVGEIFIKENN